MKTTFTTNTSNTVYEANETMTYCWKFPFGEKGKRVRISKREFLEAQQIHEQERVQEENERQNAANEFVNIEPVKAEEPEQPKAKKVRKTRKSKDIAYEGNGVTLTAKQVDFIKHLPDTDFWENGLESSLWTDVLADQIGGQFSGKPMTVGAMISTICEKGLAERGKMKINRRIATYMVLTELGKLVADELGLH